MPLLPWGKRYEAVRRAEELLRECCQRLDLEPKALGKSGREWVASRKWEKDPAEMRRMIYAAALAAQGAEVEARHFPPRRRRDHEAYTKVQFEKLALEEIVRHKISNFFETLGRVEVQDIHPTVMAQAERPLLQECLRWTKGNQLKAARVLGISRNTLRRRMKELAIEPKR